MLSEPVPPHHPGGAGKFAFNLAVALTAIGHEVTMLCVNPSIDSVEQAGDVAVHWVKAEEDGWNEATFERRTAAVLPRMLALHAAARFDVVHDCGGYLYFEAFADFVGRTGTPGLTHLLLLMAPYLAEAGVPTRFVDSFNARQQMQCRASRAVITTSRMDSAFYRALLDGAPPDHVIPNAVLITRPEPADLAWFNEAVRGPAGNARLLFVGGRLDDRVKGGDRAIDLARALCAQDIPCRLLTTGKVDAGLREECGDLAIELGRLSEARLTAVLMGSDAVLCPSRYEAFGLLAVEAAAVGTPVFASRVGGHLDTLGRGVAGRLLDDREWADPGQDLIARFHALKTAPPRAAIQVPEGFSLGRVVADLAAIYRAAIEAPLYA